MEILTCGDFEMDVEIWYKMKCTSCYSCMHFFTDGTGKPNCRLEKHDMPEFIKLHDEYYLKNSEKSIAKKILENILIETWNFSENDLKGFFKRLEWERKIIHPLDVKPCEDYIHDGFSTEFKGVFQCHSCLLMRWDDARNRMNCSIKARNRNRFESDVKRIYMNGEEHGELSMDGSMINDEPIRSLFYRFKL